MEAIKCEQWRLKGIEYTRAKLAESFKKILESKEIHDQCNRNISRYLISGGDTFLWLLTGDLKAEPESEL
jgi:hypothetical protein